MRVTYSINGSRVSKKELQNISVQSETLRRVQARLQRQNSKAG